MYRPPFVLLALIVAIGHRGVRAGRKAHPITEDFDDDDDDNAETESYQRLMTEQQIIAELLEKRPGKEDYDWRVRPLGSPKPHSLDSPVIVTVNMYLRTISKVDDVNMEYSLHFTFREEWLDERLVFNSPTLKHIILAPGQNIWMPDTFFQNEKEGKKHDIDSPNVLLRVYNGTGQILYSVRMTLTLSCPMQLHNYPMDIQICFIDYASYAYTAQDIEYVWKKVEPVQIKVGLRQSLPSFVLSDVRTDNCTSVTNTDFFKTAVAGVYSCLRTILELKREFSYYLLQLYIPSLMLVAVSWVSFWLDKDSVPARVTLGVTTLLTMTTQASGVNAKLPPVSYTKAIDVWIGVCLAFIFGALLEFALVNWAARKDMLEDNRKRQRINHNLLDNDNDDSMQSDYRTSLFDSAPPPPPVDYPRFKTANRTPFTRKSVFTKSTYSRMVKEERKHFARLHRNRNFWYRMWHVKYRQKSKRIDVLARIFFPIAFILFNCGYWVRYLKPYLAVSNYAEY